MNLQSKVQYKYYEPGEFTCIAERTFEEVAELISKYPWNEQRHLTSVELTCPSVTVRNIEGDYLKIGAGYYNKFNLYLYTSQGRLLKNVVENMASATSLVRDFYDGKELLGFYKERFIFNAKKHFETNPFKYSITWKRILVFSSYKVITWSLVMLYIAFFLPHKAPITVYTFLLMFFFWFFIAGINLLLLINYWMHDRSTVITISKGIDRFWHGMYGALKEYNKQDIKIIRTSEVRGRKIPWMENVIIEIEFNNGEIITFSNLLIPDSAFYYKTPDLPRERIEITFPFIR
jgi:hypothetical protein